ncbi:MAG: aldose 1-epimerase family protein [Planctomycetota bacterium]|nr:aldose 1-epimerase family protein [Planctomycetota bacterium]
MPVNQSLFSRCLAFLIFNLAVDYSHAAAKEIVLLSAENSVRHEAFDLRQHISSKVAKQWLVELTTLHGGMQEGCQLLTIHNGKLKLLIVPNRGMSILRVEDTATGKVVFGWDSPVKEIVNPQFIDLESRGGLGWLYGFNEWMVRCGLEFAGHPGLDVMRSNTGDDKELDLTLHGRIGNIPASELQLQLDEDNPTQLIVRGVIEERMFYGPQLRLVSELIIHANANEFRLKESVHNLSAADQEYQIIYHTNFGKPLLEAGAKVVLPTKKVTPMNQHAADSIETYETYMAPTLGFSEQVYLIEPWCDKNGITGAVLHDRKRQRGALMTWSIESLPYLTLWKNTAALADGYVTGIEPGSGYPFNRRIERHFGRVPVLRTGESQVFDLNYKFLENESAVVSAIERIEGIRDGREAKVFSSPPELPDFE